MSSKEDDPIRPSPKAEAPAEPADYLIEWMNYALDRVARIEASMLAFREDQTPHPNQSRNALGGRLLQAKQDQESSAEEWYALAGLLDQPERWED